LTAAGRLDPYESAALLVPCLGVVEENGILEILKGLFIQVDGA